MAYPDYGSGRGNRVVMGIVLEKYVFSISKSKSVLDHAGHCEEKGVVLIYATVLVSVTN